jgi:hypothetical protein
MKPPTDGGNQAGHGTAANHQCWYATSQFQPLGQKPCYRNKVVTALLDTGTEVQQVASFMAGEAQRFG